MTDTITPEHRSWTMSQIRSRDTKPELTVRRYLFAKGLRFRVSVKNLPGHPDIVLPKYKAIVEVRGCFWHRHQGCKTATTPKSNIEFWQEKFTRNVVRDAIHEKQWAELGWRLFVVWECELKPSLREDTLCRLYESITSSPSEYGLPEISDPPMAAEERAEYR